ncbi:uncharacterized protein LOC111376414 [Olea europaea var. sylvestris]|uniref:uncharacterized protein LOC111376414 n=1 Tax=Olea europaea var. sylvestris TaxID=158386 RepID=UPI000C1CD2B3|nr:uncharacterized protein LOC111376414 [Olea europaea var. sylvestris]
MKSLVLFKVMIVLLQLCGCSFGKECTNIPTILSSHTVRYELLSSGNETWKKEMFSHYHLTPTDDSAWSNLLPRKRLKEDEYNWAMMYRTIKNSGGVEGLLKEVSLNAVRLDPNSMYGQAQQTNLEYLLMLDVDSLVWSFRKTAGLETPGEPYGGWEAPSSELRGHFVGHYMSASAKMWASTHNDSLKQQMTAVVSALSSCQEKMGTGYLSAFPSEQFDRFEAIKPVWAPYYTIHKILAGLVDQYTVAGNAQALKMTTWMVDYFYNRVQNVISKYTLERHWLSLNEETGGMNDVLYKLHSITGDQKHLLLAHLFDKPCFLGLLAVKADDISGFHANTHIPVVIGSQMRYEVTGDPLYKLMNGVLSIQRGREPGVMIYMLPLRRGASKARSYHGWGTKYDSFWCCYGTGIESFSKLGDSIYFEKEGNTPALYIIQYVSSSLDWKMGHISLNQEVERVVSWDQRLQVTVTISSKEQIENAASTLNFRIPPWTYSNGAKASLNGQDIHLAAPGNFLSLTRNWNPGDKITLELPISLRTETIKDDRPEYASVQAIFYGPYLLAGFSTGDWDIKADLTKSISDWITPVPTDYNSHLISLSQESGNAVIVLTNSNQSIKMENFPQEGNDSAVSATFRLVLKDATESTKFSGPTDAIGKLVMLEPLDLPGMLIVDQGVEQYLGISDSSKGGGSSTFRLISGLDGTNGTVSLESEDHEGCFVYSSVDYQSGTSVKLSCKSSDSGFKQAASFTLREGLSEYHPISFVAKGTDRNFLLAPLLSLRDESYTVYFNLQA